MAVLVNFQSLYCFAIGRRGVLSLGGWTPHIRSGFHETESTPWADQLPVTGLSPSSVGLSSPFALPLVYPLSLAATHGVAVAFLSSGY